MVHQLLSRLAQIDQSGTPETPAQLLFSTSFLMYFNEGKEKKKCGKDKDQTNKKHVKNKWRCEPWLPFAWQKHLTVQQAQLDFEIC